MTTRRWLAALLVAPALVLGFTGCRRGPAEKAGHKIDRAVDKANDKIQDAGDKIDDTVNK